MRFSALLSLPASDLSPIGLSATGQVRIDSFGLSVGNREARADRQRAKTVSVPRKKGSVSAVFGPACLR
jgi:hypothetical protein